MTDPIELSLRQNVMFHSVLWCAPKLSTQTSELRYKDFAAVSTCHFYDLSAFSACFLCFTSIIASLHFIRAAKELPIPD